MGDTFKKDVLGALNTGMRAVWYNAKGKQIPEDADKLTVAYQEKLSDGEDGSAYFVEAEL